MLPSFLNAHHHEIGDKDNDNDGAGLLPANTDQDGFAAAHFTALPQLGVWAGAAAAKLAAAPTPGQVLYLQEAGTTAPISVFDINQAGLGDCYLLSAIGEIAMTNPNYIANQMIKSDGHGRELVSLFTGSNKQAVNLSTATFAAKVDDVTNSFADNAVNSWTAKDTVKGVKEMWPQVIEKAYADLNGGYSAIGNGGYDKVAMETLTGQVAQYTPIGQANLATLKTLKPGSIMEFDTPGSSSLGYGLVNDHAYMFAGFQTAGKDTMVKLLNPWGDHEPGLVPWSQVTHEFAGITIGHVG